MQVFDLVDEYENSQKKPFLVYGYSLRDFMNHIRQNYEVEKENMKIARVSKRLSLSIFSIF